MKKPIRDFLIMIAIAVVVFFGLRLTLQTYVVLGPSMEPNFYTNQRLLVNKVVYNFHEPERGDVIIFHPPYEGRDSFIKRVIGLPGERVEMTQGTVYIHQPDGSVLELDEPYIEDPARRSYLSEIIPEDEYFVLGDNRNNTDDSRNGWTVPDEDIIGKAWISIWPPDMWGMAANYPFREQVASAASD
ncbi:MAG TPA: signal peptidase I [Dehalococcoidia bacterium]|nr:signal peptidase I [Dehalococcoidia bacterium]